VGPDLLGPWKERIFMHAIVSSKVGCALSVEMGLRVAFRGPGDIEVGVLEPPHKRPGPVDLVIWKMGSTDTYRISDRSQDGVAFIELIQAENER
jgi:hypothetical protein